MPVIPSAGLSFGGSNGIYHSNYDHPFTKKPPFSPPFSRPRGPPFSAFDPHLALRFPALARCGTGSLALRLAHLPNVIPFGRWCANATECGPPMATGPGNGMGEDLGMEVELYGFLKESGGPGCEEAARAFSWPPGMPRLGPGGRWVAPGGRMR